jgi:hypothetical protein
MELRQEQIRGYEDRAGAKVAEYEIHLSGAGQIAVEVLATKAEVNRLEERELIADLTPPGRGVR